MTDDRLGALLRTSAMQKHCRNLGPCHGKYEHIYPDNKHNRLYKMRNLDNKNENNSSLGVF